MEEWKQRLKAAREKKELKKNAFAKLVEVSNPTVTDWEKSVESGGINEISAAKLMKVCEVLGITPDWLYYGKGQAAPDAKPALVAKSAEEARLLTAFRLADDRGRDQLNSAVDALLNRLEQARRHKA